MACFLAVGRLIPFFIAVRFAAELRIRLHYLHSCNNILHLSGWKPSVACTVLLSKDVTKQHPKSEKTQTTYRRFPFVCARRVPLFPPLSFFRFFSGLVFTMSMGMDSRCEAHVSFWRAVVFNPGLPITALFHHETAQWNFGIASSAATGWFWVPNACLIVFRFVFSGAGLRLPKGATFPQKKLFQGPQRWALVDCLPEPWWDENRCDMMWN